MNPHDHFKLLFVGQQEGTPLALLLVDRCCDRILYVCWLKQVGFSGLMQISRNPDLRKRSYSGSALDSFALQVTAER